MAKTLDLKRLRAFHAVAKQGNLRRAAGQLLLTAPAVFAQVRGLEDDLGVKLLERAGRGLSLTSAGKILLAKTTPVFDAINDAIDAVSGPTPIRNRISLAIVNDLTQNFAGTIGRFVENNPDIDLSLRVRRSPEIISRVVDGEVDLGIGYFGPLPRDIVKTTLRQSGFSLVCTTAHPLARLRKPRLEEIARYRLIGFSPRSNMGRRIASAFAAKGLSLIDPIEAGSCQSSKEFAEVGVGAAIIHSVCLGAKRSRHLHVLDFGKALGLTDIAVIRRRSLALTAGHMHLIDVLRHHAQDTATPSRAGAKRTAPTN